MKRNEAYPSNFLKSDDIGDGEMVLTIAHVENEELGQGSEKDVKPVVSFKETDKKLVCNVTNWDAIEQITGETDSDNWVGHKITLITMQVQYGGKQMMGIRVSLKKPASKFSKPVFKPAAKAAGKPANKGISAIEALCVKSAISESVLMEFLVSCDLAEQGWTLDALSDDSKATVIAQWDEFSARIKEVVG